MHAIKPFLWFNDNAEEAVAFYLSVFKNAKAGVVFRCGEAGPLPPGKALTVAFEMGGIEFVALNGGPGHTFNEAVSFVIPCDTQAEIDDLWEKLTADGGQEIQCGWLRDKFGLCWQVVPANIAQLLAGKDSEGANGPWPR